MVSVDITGDHAYFDGLAAITYTVGGAPTVGEDGVVTETGTAVAVASALRQLLTRKEIEHGPAVAGEKMLRVGDVSWTLPTAELGSVRPKRGDTITDGASVVYRVLYAEERTLLARWRVYARR